MQHFPELEAFLETQRIAYERNAILKEYTTFRIGGSAAFLVQPDHADQLALLQKWLSARDLPVFLLGGGSNLLISDDGFAGVVINPHFGEEPRILHESTERLQVYVPASARAPLAGKKISALGFTGLEFLTTIPGHFGGSVIQNAGCYGHELKDSLVNVELVHVGEVAMLAKQACEFRYRNSLFKRDSRASGGAAGADRRRDRGPHRRLQGPPHWLAAQKPPLGWQHFQEPACRHFADEGVAADRSGKPARHQRGWG